MFKVMEDDSKLGRSSMQGTPWYYEFIPYKDRTNGKRGFSNKGKRECVSFEQYGKDV